MVRPFISKGKIKINSEIFKKWGLNKDKIKLVYSLEKADALLIPFTINYYYNNRISKHLKSYNDICKSQKIRGFGIVVGDFGKNFQGYENLTYFRLNGFKKQLHTSNIGIPAILSDQHIKYFGNEISINSKKEKPIVGFCGHATSNKLTYAIQSMKFLKENSIRFFKNPFEKNFEPIFQSAYERFKILKKIESCPEIISNFIYREKYRAGAKSVDERKKSTLEYYENIRESDYIICIRGTGNFSIRFFETLMMGRIPVFIDTDCLLPFPNLVNWQDHMIWIKWRDIELLPKLILEFHESITDVDFKQIQKSNRKLWKEKFNPNWIIQNLIET